MGGRRSRKKKANNNVGTDSSNNRNGNGNGTGELNAAAAGVHKLNTAEVSNNDLQNGDMGFFDPRRNARLIATSKNCPPSTDEIVIKLTGKSLEEGVAFVKDHLTYGVYLNPTHILRIYLEAGMYRSEAYFLKRAIVDLLRDEGLKWEFEFPDVVSITFDGRKELKFMKEGRISGCRVSII